MKIKLLKKIKKRFDFRINKYGNLRIFNKKTCIEEFSNDIHSAIIFMSKGLLTNSYIINHNKKKALARWLKRKS